MCDDVNIAEQGSNASRKADAKVYKMSDIVSDVNKNWQRLQDSYNVLQHDLDRTKEHHEYLENMRKDLQDFLKSTRPDALQTISTNDTSVIVQLKRRFQKLEEAVSIHERDLDQERKHNESLKKMHKDLEEFVTTNCDQRNRIFKFVSSKPVTNVHNVVSHISEHYRQLQGELDEYNDEVQRLKSCLDYNAIQCKSKTADLKREIDNLKKDLQENTCQYEMTKKKLYDQKKANLEIAEKQIALQKHNSAQKNEIDAVKSKLNQAHRYITIYDGNQKQNESIINLLNGTINEQSNQIQQQTSHIRRQDQTIERLEKHLATLEEEHTKLTLRLSKLKGAHLTRNNPNITDLSDVNRPTRLAEKYSELYDNEWKDAYEECTDAWKMDEEMCVATMLDMLRKADAECLKLLQPHRDILNTLTAVTVTLEKPAETQDTHADLGICSFTKDESTQTDLILVDPEDQTEPCARIDELVQTKTMLNLEELKEEDAPMDTDENNTREESPFEITEVSGRSQCQQYDLSCSTETPAMQGTQADDQHPEGPAASQNKDGTEKQEEEQTVQNQMQSTVEMTELSGRRQYEHCQQSHLLCSTEAPIEQMQMVADLPFEMNVDTGEEIAEIIINGDFTEEQMKVVSDMRKYCGTKLEHDGSISKVIAMKIAREKGIDIKSSDNLMTYITKCAQLCWYMAIQEPPVVIGFKEIAADEYFDKDIYKAYTKVGKEVDYVVWPAVYLYKDGPMLCKGTAQGKD